VIDMPNDAKFKIICYMAWSGTEATFEFDDERQYEVVRAALCEIAEAHCHIDKLSPAASNWYCIEEGARQAFEKLMRG
jgi:hypothetical protein